MTNLLGALRLYARIHGWHGASFRQSERFQLAKPASLTLRLPIRVNLEMNFVAEEYYLDLFVLKS